MTAPLTARQLKFLELAARFDGYCPWDPPIGAPVLRNDELAPIIEQGLAAYRDSAGGDAWFTTAAGAVALATGGKHGKPN